MLPIITLTTDFGADSAYVAQMKASIYNIAPAANVVDITHSIPAQNIQAGAVVLQDTAFQFPPGSIHVVVVDPGVGSQREIVAASIDGHWFVAPDNGVLTGVARERAPKELRCVSSTRLWRAEVSNTFHGRDIMAPVAAHLSIGVTPEEIGPLKHQLHRLPWPEPSVDEDRLIGEVVYIDSFGNLITNISRQDSATWTQSQDVLVECGGRVINSISKTYADQPPNSLVALFGSSARLEIATVNGNAAEATGIVPGSEVVVRRR